MGLVQKATIFYACTLSCFMADALDVTKLNLSFQYNAAAHVECKYRISQSANGLAIYYSLASDSLLNYQQYFLVQASYDSPGHDTLSDFTLDTLALSPTAATYKLTIKNPRKLLLITLFDERTNIHWLYDVPLSSPTAFPSFIPTTPDGMPHLTNYVVNEQLQISGQQEQYHVFQYEDSFGPADPAMGLMKAIAPSLDIDSSFYVGQSLSALEDYHFYLIQADSLDDNGVTLLKCPSYYPEFKKLEELIAPLTYITTPNEIKNLTNQMTRHAFEDFWIKTYGTKFRARNAIKIFYDRVETANRHFTDYKQGWETDRGMLYIVFGPPAQVIRSDRKEIWHYNQEIEFEFIRISTLFTPSLYSLKRSKKYEELWYTQVANIRKGM